MATVSKQNRRTPWHLWVIAILTLLWNGSGAFTIMMAQAGRLADVGPEEAAYYADQPLWLVVSTGVALLAPLAAAVALLVRSRAAVWLFTLALVVFVINNLYEIASGASLMLMDQGWLVVTIIIGTIAVLQLAYARAMRKGAVLG